MGVWARDVVAGESATVLGWSKTYTGVYVAEISGASLATLDTALTKGTVDQADEMPFSTPSVTGSLVIGGALHNVNDYAGGSAFWYTAGSGTTMLVNSDRAGVTLPHAGPIGNPPACFLGQVTSGDVQGIFNAPGVTAYTCYPFVAVSVGFTGTSNIPYPGQWVTEYSVGDGTTTAGSPTNYPYIPGSLTVQECGAERSLTEDDPTAGTFTLDTATGSGTLIRLRYQAFG